MKLLQNKKTGEIGYLVVGKGSNRYTVTNDEWDNCGKYNSLSELTEEWEDVPEEPKSKYLYVIDPTRINFINNVYKEDEPDWCEQALELGIGFETREEAEKAVEKLKAWKRLKDKGFRFVGRSIKDLTITYSFDNYDKSDIEQMNNDLDLLFGGEE